MKIMRFSGDKDEYEARAESLIGRDVRVNNFLWCIKGQVLGWRWWFDNHLRAEVLQVEIVSGGQRFYMNIDYVRELK